MPKVFNTSWLAVILATLSYFMFGWIWYGLLFDDIWMASSGITEAMAQANMDEKGGMIWVGAIAMSLGQAIGVLMMIHHRRARSFVACLIATFWLIVTIGLPILAYTSVWGTIPLSGFLLDAGHMLVGYLMMAAIYSLFRGKAALASEVKKAAFPND